MHWQELWCVCWQKWPPLLAALTRKCLCMLTEMALFPHCINRKKCVDGNGHPLHCTDRKMIVCIDRGGHLPLWHWQKNDLCVDRSGHLPLWHWQKWLCWHKWPSPLIALTEKWLCVMTEMAISPLWHWQKWLHVLTEVAISPQRTDWKMIVLIEVAISPCGTDRKMIVCVGVLTEVAISPHCTDRKMIGWVCVLTEVTILPSLHWQKNDCVCCQKLLSPSLHWQKMIEWTEVAISPHCLTETWLCV